MSASESSAISSCRILWSTQSGRSKACARRTARILGEKTMLKLEGGIGSPFDEMPLQFLDLMTAPKKEIGHTLILMFVSTTGDGEHCDSIRNTWKSLLQKSLPRDMLAASNYEFAMFCLGDRAYGPQFCAAGRKLAVRLLQLGMPSFCDVGYGDDNTPNGGVFRDLDDWLDNVLFPKILEFPSMVKPIEPVNSNEISVSKSDTSTCPYRVQIAERNIEKSVDSEFLEESYRNYFKERGPVTAYSYARGERILTNASASGKTVKPEPMLGTVVKNERITDSNWKQNTRHIEIELMLESNGTKEDYGTDDSENLDANCTMTKNTKSLLPYMAGDVASILPFNSSDIVNRFLSVLPDSLSSLADTVLQIELDKSYVLDNRYTRWPVRCTLRGWLMYCADIQSLPEREDLRTLSAYCAPRNDNLDRDSSLDQSNKLRSFSESSGAALYADYILREKRSWIDLFYDFESLREPESRLTVEALLMILPPMRARDFSIASSPSMEKILMHENDNNRTTSLCKDGMMKRFPIELCVGVVEGKTRLGRSYCGTCSKFLSQINAFLPKNSDTNGNISLQSSSQVIIWIRPGSFGKMPITLRHDSLSSFEVPIICIGAGTGIAPMRSLILERMAVRFLAQNQKKYCTTDDSKTNSDDELVINTSQMNGDENILVFGCRKKDSDYYYRTEWEKLRQQNNIRLLTAFSQDQRQKMYVQKVLRDADDGALIAKHILEHGGAVFIAGNPKMARAVKQEISEVLSDILPGGEKQTIKLLHKMQRLGRFTIEAWS